MSEKNRILNAYNEVNTFGKLLGMEFEIPAPGEVVYRMKITENHLSNPHAAHGGAVAALMDGVLGVAALSLAVMENNLVSTVEFKINYYEPVKLSDILVGNGKVVFKGNKILSSEGSIICENTGKLVCKGLGTFNIYPSEKNPGFSQ